MSIKNIWEQLSEKEQSLCMLFSCNVSNINLQPDFLSGYLSNLREQKNEKYGFQTELVKEILRKIEEFGLGKFDNMNPTLFRLNPLYSVFLKRQVNSLNEEDKHLIQLTYVNFYEGIAHSYHSIAESENIKKKLLLMG